MSRALMCHVVAGYPTEALCLKLISGMERLGVAAIEIQIPFSDPIADGEAIMEANDVAIKQGMTIESSFRLIEMAAPKRWSADMYVMSYIQKIQHFGAKEFCKRAADCGAKGLIIPDVPYDSPEFSVLHKLTAQHRIAMIPVISPGMSAVRLNAILNLKPSIAYLTSQRGITGATYASTKELCVLADAVKKCKSITLLIGFGIRSPQDVEDALQLGDMAVVGSAIVRSLQTSNFNETLEYVKTLLDDKVLHKRSMVS